MAKKRAKKVPVERIDGLSATDRKKLHSANRMVWHWSYPKRLCLARATDKNGWLKCEECKKKVPKLFVDHKNAVGEVGAAGYIERLFCPSSELQAICKKCHQAKTNEEKRLAREKEKWGF